MYVCAHALEAANQPAQVHGEQKAVEGAGEGQEEELIGRENQDQEMFNVNKTYLLDCKLNAQTRQTLIYIAAVVCL